MIKPPIFCQNAIPTNMGWQDPTTKRIIVPIVGLLDKIQQEMRTEQQTKTVHTQPKPIQLNEPAPEISVDNMLVEPAPDYIPEAAAILVELEASPTPTKKRRTKYND